MNGKQGGMSIGIGGISILAVFVILCLTTLAALSFTSAQADYRLAQKTVDTQRQYYAADTQAQTKVANILALAKGNADFEEDLTDEGYTVTKEGNNASVAFMVDVGENKQLCVQLDLALSDDGMPDGAWEVMSWQTQVQDTDDAPEGLHVLK